MSIFPSREHGPRWRIGFRGVSTDVDRPELSVDIGHKILGSFRFWQPAQGPGSRVLVVRRIRVGCQLETPLPPVGRETNPRPTALLEKELGSR